jgi:ABC-2 type transport system permease protein
VARNVYVQAFMTSLQTKLEYRADFFMGVGAALSLQAAGLGMLGVVLSQIPSLAGWSGMQVALLFGLTTAVQGLSELLFNHIWYMPTYVIRGQIDRLLSYPVKSLPFFLLTSPELHAFGNLAGGILIYAFASARLGQPWWAYAMLPYWIVCGCLVHTSALVLCGAMCFLIKGQRGQQYWVVNALLQATRYPVSVFPNPMQVVLLFVMPFAAMNYLPVGWTLGQASAFSALAVPALAAGLGTWLAFKAWDYGLSKYESTGS